MDGLNINLNEPITLDLSEISTEPVPTGWHTVTIERAEAKLTRQKKLPSIFVMSRITDEADPDYNRTIIWNAMLDGDGLMFTKKFFTALGMPEQLEYDSYQALADDLLGREVEAKVKHRQYEGETQASVNDWREPSLDIEL
jgi:hypothetical protein